MGDLGLLSHNSLLTTYTLCDLCGLRVEETPP